MLLKKRVFFVKELAILLLVFLFFGVKVNQVFAADETLESSAAVVSNDSLDTKETEAPISADLASMMSASSGYQTSEYDESRKPVENKIQIDSDPVTGSFTYAYPITTPPGRNGMQPDLNLVYNNQNSNNANIFGYGWSINIPYIERINKKGVETLFSQSYFNSSLTGELTKIGTSTSFGSKIDNGEFLKYELIDNTYWQVTNKNGVRYIYGLSAGSRQDNIATSTQVFKWMLEKVIDTNGNYIIYNYYKDGGQIYPEAIKYTGFNNIDGIFEVDFLRETRTDISTSTDTGFNVRTTYRINQISAKINGILSKQYQLSYQTGDNNSRTLLSSIVKSGRDENNNLLVMPPDVFSYQRKEKSWNFISSYNLPTILSHGDVRWADANGDGLMDILQTVDWGGGTVVPNEHHVYINKGDGTGWVADSNYIIPTLFNYGDVRLADVNGDGLVDILQTVNWGGGTVVPNIYSVYINKGDGTGWAFDSNYAIPILFNYKDDEVIDVNGDGLADIVHTAYNQTSTVYINKGDGTGWALNLNYTVPTVLSYGDVRWTDVNGDGLMDILQTVDWGGGTVVPDEYHVYINKGDGTGWISDSNYIIPTLFDHGDVRLADVNGDGLVDILQTVNWGGGTAVQNEYHAYINKGDGTGWALDSNYAIPILFNYKDDEVIDVNGDGLADIVHTAYRQGGPNDNSIYISKKSNADLLSKIDSNKGSKISVVYKSTPEYLDSSNNLLNPKDLVSLQTVYQIGVDDGLGNVATSTYYYIGGKYYYNNPYDKKFAGFNEITKTDPDGNVTKNYYHQGDTSSTSTGEYDDHISKIGKVYRTENYDNSGNLYSKNINKWDRSDLGNDRNFVKLAQSVSSDYDGTSTHKDKAQTFTYSNTTGNKIQDSDWGQVNSNDDGTFSDINTDLSSTTITYAASTTPYIIGLPSQKTIFDQNNNKISDTKYYYDNLISGNVDKGNLTKQENWVANSSYVNTQKTYNSYGLVTQDKDQRGKNTNYVYDAYDLYVATSTNPLNQLIRYSYNYSNGKPKKVVDANNQISETVFDGLDRIIQENQPDIYNSGATTTKTIYQYVDTGQPRMVKKISFLNNSTSFNEYSYLDGLDRNIQQRSQAEGGNIFSVKDSVYNKNGLLSKDSLLYFSTGASSTIATTTSSLFSTYIYDPLSRIKSLANVIGTTTYAYNNWKTSVIDPLNHQKDLYKDARGNLIQVDEHNEGNVYSTFYQYNLLGNLIKITDALGDIRNFIYDGFGQLLQSEDLHSATDNTFGLSSFTYDNTGNLSQKINPNNQTINYTYDDLNRVLTEDYVGQNGTEVVYGYDLCLNGVGRLCSATTTAAITNYTYNALGLINAETKKIGTSTSVTQYDYDRQGNTILLTYPDNSLVKYDYNSAGLLEKISKKEINDQDYLDVVSDFNYNPLGQTSYSLFGNGAKTYNSYDQNELYRLKNKFTILPDYGYTGSGVRSLLARVSSQTTLAPASDEARKFNNKMSKLVATTNKKSVASKAASKVFAQASQSTVVASSLLSSNTPPNKSTNMLTEGMWLTETITDNDSFEDGLNNWNNYSSNGGSFSSDCSTAYSGNCSAKISVATSSPNWWDSFVLQQVRLDAGMNYTLKFKAKAATSTNIMMSVSQNHDPYYSLGLQKYASIGTSWKTYSYSFTAGSTDLAARIMFGFGEKATDYWVDDVQIVPDNLNQIKNSGFEDSFYNGWQFWSYGGTSSSTNAINCSNSIEGTCFDYTHNQQAGANWEVQLFQPTSITSTDTYVLTFYAKADSNRVIHPALVQNHDPWSDLTPSKDVAITTNWTKYSIELTPSTTDINSRLMFYLGDYAPGLYLDDVHLWVKRNTKLTTNQPNFSAVYADSDTGDTASSYQLQLIEKRGNFSSPLWDSGKTSMSATSVGSTTPAITYNGPSISAWDGKLYYWRLKLWDASDTESSWTNGRDYFQMYGNNAQDISYSYDSIGNIIQTIDKSYTDAAKIMDYTYDDLSRLTIASSTKADNNQNYRQTYSYNAIGNILNKSDIGNYLYNGNQGTDYANPNAATSINGVNSTYDNNGNLIIDGVLNNTWNYNNLLLSSTKGTSTIQYSYDQNGSRVTYLANGTTAITPNKYYEIKGSDITKYIYAGNELAATLNTTSDGSNIYYNHNDNLSGSNAISNASSTVEEAIDYYPFGGIRLDKQQGGFNEKKKFTGHEYDADTGLNYMGARYQSGSVGRFISQDPVTSNLVNLPNKKFNELLRSPQELNYYSYVANNPLRNIDPNGEELWDVVTGRQTWNDYIVETGEAANYMYENNSIARAAMNHPYITGATVGLAGGATAYAGAIGVTYGLTQAGLIGSVAPAAHKANDYVQKYGNDLGAKMLQVSERLEGSGYKFTDHAVQRIAERLGVGGEKSVINVLQNSKSFNYAQDGVSKLGYYDSASKVFVGQIKDTGNITTVITNVSNNYIKNLTK